MNLGVCTGSKGAVQREREGEGEMEQRDRDGREIKAGV